ncbi:MAG: hypothetical protein HFH49_03305 [Lachnospiraceae bacterium]|nr:hypothetical protein [Lachnospiraceae bacterium]
MKQSIRCKGRACRLAAALTMLLAVSLSAGCGNRDTADKNVPQANQSENQTLENQSQTAGAQNQSGAGEQNSGQDQSAGEQNQQTQASGQGNSVNQPKIGMEEAKEAALKHAGLTAREATFVKEEMDYEDGRTEYELEFVSGTTRYQYEISAEDGAVLESSQEAIEQIPGNIQGVISVDEAKAAVLNHAGFTAEQVAYTKIELEQEHGGAEYEIDFYAEGKEYSSKVDAVTGAILEYEMD